MQNKAIWPVLKGIMRLTKLLLFLLVLSITTRAADFKETAEVLRQATQASPKSLEKKEDPNQPFRDKLKAFQLQNTNLPPSQAAAQWLALVDEFEKQSGDSANS